MQQIISISELRRRFRHYYEAVVRARTSLVITRGSTREAVLMPHEEYMHYLRMRETEVLAKFDQVWDRLAEANTESREEELVADIKAARRE